MTTEHEYRVMLGDQLLGKFETWESAEYWCNQHDLSINCILSSQWHDFDTGEAKELGDEKA